MLNVVDILIKQNTFLEAAARTQSLNKDTYGLSKHLHYECG